MNIFSTLHLQFNSKLKYSEGKNQEIEEAQGTTLFFFNFSIWVTSKSSLLQLVLLICAHICRFLAECTSRAIKCPGVLLAYAHLLLLLREITRGKEEESIR
ncbi:hypothetical protein ACET3Z_004709 [Daucus carota]